MDIQQKGIRLVLSPADMVVDDADPVDGAAELSAAVQDTLDRMLAETEANAFGASTVLTSDSRALTIDDVRKAMDVMRAALPPWSIFWDQAELIESPWLDPSTGCYVLDREATRDAGLGWLPGERRFVVLVDPAVKRDLNAAGIDDRDLAAMAVWKARNDRVAKYGPEAWPLDLPVLKNPHSIFNTNGS